MFCPTCGKKNVEDANFCSFCGASLNKGKTEEFQVSSDDLIKTVKKLLHEGNVRRIIIKDNKGKILLDMPVTIGLIGAIIAPWLAALGVIGAMVTKCTIVVEKK